MADNKKVEPPKAGATGATGPTSPAEAQQTKGKVQADTPNTTSPVSADAAAPARTPADQPGEKVKPPTVDEVKQGAEIKAVKGTEKSGPTPEETLNKHVDDVKKSVESYNASNEAVAAAKPFVKPETKTVPAKTADERLSEQVERVGQSVAAYNESQKQVDTAGAEQSRPGDIADKAAAKAKAEVSRVAPLTGELRADPENDSYVTPGKVLAPKEPTPGDLAPEVEQAPLVINPLGGEIKPADELSYPTPGHARDMSLAHKALEKNRDTLMAPSGGKGKFGVAPGQQVSLLHANEELWAGDEARLEDQKTRALEIAQAITAGDGLRRTRRAQKNLR